LNMEMLAFEGVLYLQVKVLTWFQMNLMLLIPYWKLQITCYLDSLEIQHYILQRPCEHLGLKWIHPIPNSDPILDKCKCRAHSKVGI
jgi:hypothetical protein